MGSAGRRLVYYAVVVACVALAVRALVAVTRMGSLRDLVDYSLFGWDERTRYAAGFKENAFLRVRAGMSAADVNRRLGEPLSVREDTARKERVYYYALPREREGSYWARYVVFDSAGRVVTAGRVFDSD